MTRAKSQPAWKKIVDKEFSDYSKLNRDERVLFNIEPLVELGVWDHYMNTGADHNADTIDDLEYLNFSSIANLLRNFNSKYFTTGVPIGSDARAEKLDSFSEGQLEKDIDEMKAIFWAHCEDLNTAFQSHIQKTENGRIYSFRKQYRLFLAIDMTNADIVSNSVTACLEKGLISFWFLSCPSSFRIAPPLTISFEEIDMALAVTGEAIGF